MKPRLLDLFCCQGGAATGYADAGFDVVGVDIVAQPRYPFEFRRADALDVFRSGAFVHEGGVVEVADFDVIHASPPCQHYAAVTRWRGSAADHPDLVGPTRLFLQRSGLPWIMENVREAELHHPIMLCGSMFGLRVKRHRYFESSIPLPLLAPASCSHHRLLPFEHKGERAYADAMECEWMSARGARLGEQLLEHLAVVP